MDWQFKVGLGVAVVFGLLPFALKAMPPWLSLGGVAVGLLLIVWGFLPRHDTLPMPPTIGLILALGVATSCAYLVWLGRQVPEDDDYIFFSVEIRDPTNLDAPTLPLRINNASDTTFNNVDPWFSPASAKGDPYPRNASNPYWQHRDLKIFYPFVQSGSRLYGADLPLSSKAWRIEIDSSFEGKSYSFLEFLEVRKHDGKLVALVDVWRSIGTGPLTAVYRSPRPDGIVARWKP